MPGIGTLEEVDLILKGIIGFTGALVSFLIYLHYRQQRKDAWLRDFRELHKAFWNDEAMADVRAWLANEQAYREIVSVLVARKSVEEGALNPAKISREDYIVLEKLDKFCNLMTSVQVLDPSFSNHKKLWQRLFVEYWVEQIFSDARSELGWYVDKFYKELTHDWRGKSRFQRIVSRLLRSNSRRRKPPGPKNPAPQAESRAAAY
jgi:hypothetical protein